MEKNSKKTPRNEEMWTKPEKINTKKNGRKKKNDRKKPNRKTLPKHKHKREKADGNKKELKNGKQNKM